MLLPHRVASRHRQRIGRERGRMLFEALVPAAVKLKGMENLAGFA